MLSAADDWELARGEVSSCSSSLTRTSAAGIGLNVGKVKKQPQTTASVLSGFRLPFRERRQKRNTDLAESTALASTPSTVVEGRRSTGPLGAGILVAAAWIRDALLLVLPGVSPRRATSCDRLRPMVLFFVVVDAATAADAAALDAGVETECETDTAERDGEEEEAAAGRCSMGDGCCSSWVAIGGEGGSWARAKEGIMDVGRRSAACDSAAAIGRGLETVYGEGLIIHRTRVL